MLNPTERAIANELRMSGPTVDKESYENRSVQFRADVMAVAQGLARLNPFFDWPAWKEITMYDSYPWARV